MFASKNNFILSSIPMLSCTAVIQSNVLHDSNTDKTAIDNTYAPFWKWATSFSDMYLKN